MRGRIQEVSSKGLRDPIPDAILKTVHKSSLDNRKIPGMLQKVRNQG